MAKEMLFSVVCPTCEARIGVHDKRLINQLVQCPKCGSIVLLSPPKGYAKNTAESQKTEEKSEKSAPPPAAANPQSVSEKKDNSEITQPSRSPSPVPKAPPIPVPPPASIPVPPPVSIPEPIAPQSLMPEPMSPGGFNSSSPASGKSFSQRIASMTDKLPSRAPYFVIGTGIIALIAALALLFSGGTKKDNSAPPTTPQEVAPAEEPQNDAIDKPAQTNTDNQTNTEKTTDSQLPSADEAPDGNTNADNAVAKPDDDAVLPAENADDDQLSDNETVPPQPEENSLNDQPNDNEEPTPDNAELSDNPESDNPEADNPQPEADSQPKEEPLAPDEDNPFQEVEQNEDVKHEPNEPLFNADSEIDANAGADALDGDLSPQNPAADNSNSDEADGSSPIPGLDVKLKSISIREAKLSQCLQTIRELGALPVEVNWDSLRRNGVNADDKISWSGNDVTVQKALSEVLAQRGLTFKINDEGKIVFAPQSSLNARSNIGDNPGEGGAAAMVKTQYSLSDLVGQSPEKTADLIKTIRDFLCPGDWKESGGVGTINSSGGGSVTVLQSRQNQWIIADFLDRLRLARRLAPLYNPDASLEPMSVRAQSALKRNVGINFQPTADLKTALAEIGRRISVNILLDEPSLKLAGISVQFPISFDARDMTLDEVFSRLGEEIGLVSLAQTPNSFLVTTPQGAKTVMGVEFYPISDLISLGLTPAILMEQIVKFEPSSWQTQDSARPGIVRYDPGSDCLIVRQSPAVLDKISQLLLQLRNRLKEAK